MLNALLFHIAIFVKLGESFGLWGEDQFHGRLWKLHNVDQEDEIQVKAVKYKEDAVGQDM